MSQKQAKRKARERGELARTGGEPRTSNPYQCYLSDHWYRGYDFEDERLKAMEKPGVSEADLAEVERETEEVSALLVNDKFNKELGQRLVRLLERHSEICRILYGISL